MSKSIRKINIASYRVLQTLLSLFNKNMSMNELIGELSIKCNSEFNNFVVSKYVNTCKACGIDIQKLDGKYALVNLPFGSKFTPEETQLILELDFCSDELRSKESAYSLRQLIEKLHLTFYKSNNGLKSSENSVLIKYFAKAVTASSEVELVYKDGTVRRCTPSEVIVDDGKISFRIKSDNGFEDVSPSDLADVKLVDSMVRRTKIEAPEVVFELRGKLAKRYQLRENEQMTRMKSNGAIIITNKYEDKDKLLRRLMRYDSSCKLLQPKEYIEDFRKMLDETLSNYS